MNLEKIFGRKRRRAAVFAAALGAAALVLATAAGDALAYCPQCPPAPQKASNVTIDRHGHWMVVSFDQLYATSEAYAVLTPYDIAGGSGKIGSQTTRGSFPWTHFAINVSGLTPNTEYLLTIIMKDPVNGGTKAYYYPDILKTLRRHVDVTYRWVHVDDSSDDSCGEFVFDFTASGGYQGSPNARLPHPLGGSPGAYFSLGEWVVEICEGYSWDPPNETISLVDTGNTVTTSVVGVDDDRGPFSSAHCNSLAYGGCKNIGEWADGSTSFDVEPQGSGCCEEFSTYTSFLAKQGGSGDPEFTWYIKYAVTYSD